MRSDMAKVIVERPRYKPRNVRKGRRALLDDLPSQEGMRRAHALRGQRKELNENLQPLRRYLERQVGRPWRKVYAEISQNLRIDNTVQQHVRDHLRDFVVVKPRAMFRTWLHPRSDPWWQPLYVDPVSGLLCRTDRLPQVKARRRAERNRPPAPVTRVALKRDCELRLIDGFWYHVQLAPLPEPRYGDQRETRTRFRRGGSYEVEVNVRRLLTPSVRDVATGESMPAGPAIDDTIGRTFIGVPIRAGSTLSPNASCRAASCAATAWKTRRRTIFHKEAGELIFSCLGVYLQLNRRDHGAALGLSQVPVPAGSRGGPFIEG